MASEWAQDHRESQQNAVSGLGPAPDPYMTVKKTEGTFVLSFSSRAPEGNLPHLLCRVNRRLELSHQVEAGLKRVGAWLPRGGTHMALMCIYKLRGH